MVDEKISLEKYTRKILEENNIFLKKNLGQNFLINQNIIDRIIEVSKINENDIVLEIGAGIGVLTKNLVKYAAHVIAIEIDDRFIGILNKELVDFDNITIIHNDVLKLNFNEIIKKVLDEKAKQMLENKVDIKEHKYNIKVVANLPYYISTPILLKLIESNIEEIYIMLQKELAERFLSQTGTRESGSITYYISYYTEAAKEINVSRNNFKPIPKVDSQVVSFKKRKYNNKAKDEKLLFQLIKIGFMQRRKTYLNNIKNFEKAKTNCNIKFDKIKQIFLKLDIPLNIRAEEITLDQFIEIANLL